MNKINIVKSYFFKKIYDFLFNMPKISSIKKKTEKLNILFQTYRLTKSSASEPRSTTIVDFDVRLPVLQ